MSLFFIVVFFFLYISWTILGCFIMLYGIICVYFYFTMIEGFSSMCYWGTGPLFPTLPLNYILFIKPSQRISLFTLTTSMVIFNNFLGTKKLSYRSSLHLTCSHSEMKHCLHFIGQAIDISLSMHFYIFYYVDFKQT